MDVSVPSIFGLLLNECLGTFGDKFWHTRMYIRRVKLPNHMATLFTICQNIPLPVTLPHFTFPAEVESSLLHTIANVVMICLLSTVDLQGFVT